MISRQLLLFLMLFVSPAYSYAQGYRSMTAIGLEVNTQGVAYIGIDHRQGGIIFVNAYLDGGYNFNKTLNQNRIGLGIGAGNFLLTCQLEHYTDLTYNELGVSPAMNYTFHSKDKFPSVEVGIGYTFCFNRINALMKDGLFIKIKICKGFYTKPQKAIPAYE